MRNREVAVGLRSRRKLIITVGGKRIIHQIMEPDFTDSVPCSSIAVDSLLRMSSAGVIWGSCYGPFEANRLGLYGSSRASHIAKTIGKCGVSCGLFAAIFSFSLCGIQRYRRQKDWVNTLSAGVVAGAAFGAGTRNWKQVAGFTGIFCTLFQFIKDSKSV